MALAPDWFRRKADACAIGWQWLYGSPPPARCVALALGPATHETHAGDDWPGPDGLVGTDDDDRNWGACTLRALSAAELAVVAAAGVVPTVGKGHEDAARRAQQAIVDAGLPLPHGRIHCDSRTVRGPDGKPRLEPYFVWFATFASDAEGAEYYLGILAGRSTPKGARAVLLDPAGTERELAAMMYRQGYFWGFHPHDGGAGDQANIDDYARACEALWPGIEGALAGWTPPPAPARPVRNLLLGDVGPDVRLMQGQVGAPSQDGAFGPKTLTALNAWKVAHRLPADGVWDDACRAALMGAPGPDPEMQRLLSIGWNDDWRALVDAQRANDVLAEDMKDAG